MCVWGGGGGGGGGGRRVVKCAESQDGNLKKMLSELRCLCSCSSGWIVVATHDVSAWFDSF